MDGAGVESGTVSTAYSIGQQAGAVFEPPVAR